MTILQSAHPGTSVMDTQGESIGIVTHQAADAVGCVRNSGYSDVEAYSEDKLRSLGEFELRMLAEVSGEPMAPMLGRSCFSGRITVAPLGADVVEEQKEERGRNSSSTPVKIPSGASREVPASAVVFGEKPKKRSAGVAFKKFEPPEHVCVMQPCEQRRKSTDGYCSQVAASTSASMTEIGLPEVDAMVGQGKSAGRVGAPLVGRTALGFELTPSQKLVGNEKFSQQSKKYASQSTQTMLKHFFGIESSDKVGSWSY